MNNILSGLFNLFKNCCMLDHAKSEREDLSTDLVSGTSVSPTIRVTRVQPLSTQQCTSQYENPQLLRAPKLRCDKK